MQQDSHTYRGRFKVLVKEFGDGTPWLVVEISSEAFPTLGQDFIGLEFRNDITYEQAKEFAKVLNDRIEHISITSSKFIARGSDSVS
jgi:hypothetical protein